MTVYVVFKAVYVVFKGPGMTSSSSSMASSVAVPFNRTVEFAIGTALETIVELND